MATKRHARDFTALEQCRKKAARLLSKGMPQAAVALELAVSRKSVSVWAKALDGDKQAWRRKPMGYARRLGTAQRR